MKVNPIAFTGKTLKPEQAKKLSQKALAEIFGQSDKDYISLTKSTKATKTKDSEEFIERAKKFFSNVFGQ